MLKDDTARNRRIGIALVCAGTFCFAALDACAKWLVRELPATQVVAMRFVFHALLAVLMLTPVHGRALWHMKNPRLHLLRAAMLGAMTTLNFIALQYLQLAEAGAIQFSVPILIAVISALWLGERLDARRWVAVVLGFAGVLLVLRPGTAGFHPALLLSLMNAIIYAAFNLLTRRMAASESPATMQLVSAAGAALLVLPVGLAQWQWPAGALPWTLLVLCGLFGGLGHHAVATAHRYASAAVLGPFIYLQILYMTGFGWLLFAQVPDAWVIGGAIVVVASGLYLLALEMRRG
ncbi:MAG: DMT family transporter [Aquabacterium sp.]